MKNSFPALVAVIAIAAQAGMASAKVSVPVVKGAKVLSSQEKVDVTGRCGCMDEPTKPGYGFGTTGHYGPPGQGFTPDNNWQDHASGDGLTPTGKALPPRAFQ